MARTGLSASHCSTGKVHGDVHLQGQYCRINNSWQLPQQRIHSARLCEHGIRPGQSAVLGSLAGRLQAYGWDAPGLSKVYHATLTREHLGDLGQQKRWFELGGVFVYHGNSSFG